MTKLERLHEAAIKDLFSVMTLEDLDIFVIHYFGRRNGLFTQIKQSPEANKLKLEIWQLVDDKRRRLKFKTIKGKKIK